LCRNCIQFCDEPGVNCKEGALLTQTVSYTVLTVDGHDVQPYQDLMQIKVFDEDGRQLPRTRYRITENETGLCMSCVGEINVFCEYVSVLHIQVFWDVTLCRWANFPDVSKHWSAFVFRVKQSFSFFDCLTLKAKVILSVPASGTVHVTTHRYMNCSRNNTSLHELFT